MQHSKLIFAILLAVICFIHIILFIVWKKYKNNLLDIYFKKIFVFIAPIGFVLCLMLVINAFIAKREYGITMENQIKQQFSTIQSHTYDTIILGNSRLYRGINPELLDTDCYNFAFDNDSFLECYYKLKYLASVQRLPNYVILGVDYFEFSFVSAGMQATYDLYFDKEYDEILENCQSLSFSNNKVNIDAKINKLLNSLFISNYYNTLSYIYNRYIRQDKRISYVSDTGQYCIYPQPTASEGDFLTRSSDIMDEQKVAYQNIITFCKDNNIHLVLVMLPLREIELDCYTDETKAKIDNMFSSDLQIQYINYSKLSEFSISDFMDDTHLNLIGADKFSKILNEDLNRIFFTAK